jgi:pyruvate/2-oxoglutarate dehydrogenase complex dihydrolipoamide acyltransferase (E2) component
MAEAFAVKISRIRKIIAARVTEANRMVPHLLAADIESDALLELHQQLQKSKGDTHVSLHDLLIKFLRPSLDGCAGCEHPMVENEVY